MREVIKEKLREKLNEVLITLGGKAYPNSGNVVIFAGGSGCYPKGTEFFNGSEWKNIEDFDVENDLVLQYNLDGTSNLIKPNKFIKLPVDQFINIKNRRVDFTTSLNHKHLVINEKTKRLEEKYTLELIDRHENLIRGNKCKLLTSFIYNGVGLPLSDNEIRLKIAIFADGYFLRRVHQPKVRFSFKKERKIERIIQLLNANDIEFRKYVNKDGFTRFEFNYDVVEKEFESYWYSASNKQLKIICEEVLLWDGTNIELKNKKNRMAFSTTSIKSLDLIQFAFASINIDTKILKDKREGRRDAYSLTVNYSKGVGISKDLKKDNTTHFTKIKSEDGLMYCFSVNSGYFIVRQNGKIYVSGNSGKGFIKDNLLGLEGKVIDTDQLKELYLKSLKLKTSLQNDYGLNADEFDFKNPNDVNKLHQILSAKGVNAKRIDVLSNSIKKITLKPNLIFDTTLSSLTTFNNLTTMIKDMGYELKNIHLVWVVTEYQTALKNNKKRDRVVPTIVFKDIHKGVSRTINELIQLPDLSNFMDGDIWFAFNNPVSDTTINKSDLGGKYLSQANLIKLKSSGKPIKPYNEIEDEIIDKVNSYVHKKTLWEK